MRQPSELKICLSQPAAEEEDIRRALLASLYRAESTGELASEREREREKFAFHFIPLHILFGSIQFE